MNTTTPPTWNLLALCGSTRPDSSNHRLIEAVMAMAGGALKRLPFAGISSVPAFNPDQVDQDTPGAILDFRKTLAKADAVLICTPEYAHGVPGALKNVIDWTVPTGEFSGKPTCLITASTDGRYGHQALLETLRVMEAGGIDQLELHIPFIRVKINPAGRITDPATLEAVRKLLDRFLQVIAESRAGKYAG
ncbi:MAG TPA: NADPH-dependent FMN reductase [Chitinophagaceae bacterium]|nr:NADPH-dependent FMN reductase [Chitinophagaceae bacterium]